jgi:hypothetical protein
LEILAKKTQKLRVVILNLQLIHALKIQPQRVASQNHRYASPVPLDRYVQTFVNH